MSEYESASEALANLRTYVQEEGPEGLQELGVDDPETYLNLFEKINEDGYSALSSDERERFESMTRSVYEETGTMLAQYEEIEEEYGPDEEPEKDMEQLDEEMDYELMESVLGKEDADAMRSIMQFGKQVEDSFSGIEEKNEQTREAIADTHAALEQMMDEYDIDR
ncbi:MAG: hypothetical protein MUP66_01125 [Candidatus Nanohaloarchaeota archaeon QJJ-5]|nr:hypothetical protein [Candidatus Nanohaloarchaeota archaeon QJJ-5]